jgi:Tol biopolymer transport system component
VAFVARRDGDDVSQIYLLDVVHGGEAQRITTLSTGASAPVWRPDGKALLFTSTIYPGAATGEPKAAEERRTRKWTARTTRSDPTQLARRRRPSC